MRGAGGGTRVGTELAKGSVCGELMEWEWYVEGDELTEAEHGGLGLKGGRGLGWDICGRLA